jgi:hypothetical protein
MDARGGRVSRRAVYTAIYGGYDTLREQPDQPGFDMVCFTDDPSLTSKQWRVIHAPRRDAHPRMSAKWFKLLPHRALPEYEYTVWTDGGNQIQREDFAETVLGAVGETGLGLIPHPWRDRVEDEANVCIDLAKYQNQPMLEQVTHYRRKGFADTSGLWYGGVIGRDSRRIVRKFGRRWWRENQRWTWQDQLSLPYLLWRLDLQPGVVPFAMTDPDYLQMVAHASDL